MVITVFVATGCRSNSAPAPEMSTTSRASTPQSTPKLAFASLSPTRTSTARFARLETTFAISDLKTDPFDYRKTDVRVAFRVGDKSVKVPAFFDGGTTWRARFTPSTAGNYTVAEITLNDRVLDVRATPKFWKVASAKGAGFVRLNAKDKTRFALDDGTPYFPLGHNQAWRNNDLPDIPALFDKMGAAGENWSRVWMNSWDGKNLDWPRPKGDFGVLSLDVARRWDAIVLAAEKNKIAFQMVLQHHGQYSTRVNPNWDTNPYNAKNGGFLKTPDEFFTDAQAKDLTRRKLRYAVARWGYSPSVLAWELFNEVQFTDAAHHKQWDSIAQWHREMAQFLREQDVHDHLITTSSDESLPAVLGESMDFGQQHIYATDLVTSLSGAVRATDKPSFVGEFGPTDLQDPQGVYLHAGLWAGLMSGQSGAPQYWFWDLTEKHDFYRHFRSASAFLKASDLARQKNLQRVDLTVESASKSDLIFNAGGGWQETKQSDFDLTNGQVPAAIAQLPNFLQGTYNRAMGPRPLTFRVRFAQPGRFSVAFDKIAKSGARVKLSAAGKRVERVFAPSDVDYTPLSDAATLTIDVPAGTHAVSLENSGLDWATMSRFTLSNYSSSLAAYALGNKQFLTAWVYQRANIYENFEIKSAAVSGTLTLRVLDAGKYRAVWWDTLEGKPLRVDEITVSSGAVTLQIPPVARDVALFVRRAK